MAEYIEREAVMKTARDGYHSDFGRSMADLTSLREVLEDTPTADVAEVKYAHWVLSSAFEVFGGEEQAWGRNPIADCSCSNCHKSPYCEENFLDDDTLEQIMTDFCPHCGARMDGE